MKKNLLKSMLTAFALMMCTASAWADVTPFSESYSASSTTDGWKTSTAGRYDPVILSENGDYFLSVDQSARQNNGATVTGTIISGKAAAGDDFTITFDMKLSSSSNQTATEFKILDASNSAAILSLKETGTWATTWTLNGTTTVVDLPNSNKAGGKNTIADVPWYSYKLTRSGNNTFLTITDKASGEEILPRTPISDSSETGGLGNIVFVSSRYFANFAIDNIVVREVSDEDIPVVSYTATFEETNGLKPAITMYSDAAKTNTVLESDFQRGATYYFTAVLEGYYDYEGNFTIYDYENTVSYTMTQKPRYTFAVNAVDAEGNVITNIYTDEDCYDGKTVEYITSAYLTDDNGYATYSKVNNTYTASLIASSETATIEEEYASYDDTALFFECESWKSSRTYGTATGSNYSGGKGVGLYSGGNMATQDKIISGVYKLQLATVYRNQRAHKFTIEISADGETWTEMTSITTNTTSGVVESEDEFFLPEESYIRLVDASSNNSNHYLDYILLVKTGDGRPDASDTDFWNGLDALAGEIARAQQIHDSVIDASLVGNRVFQFLPKELENLQAAIDNAQFYYETLVKEEKIYETIASLRSALRSFKSIMPGVNAEFAIQNMETGLYLNLSNGVELAETPTPIQFHNVGLIFENLPQISIDIFHTGYLYNTPNREYMGITADNDLTLTNQRLTEWYIITLTENRYIIANVDENEENGSVLSVTDDNEVVLTDFTATRTPSYWTIYWFDDVEDIAKNPSADDSSSDPATSINNVSETEAPVSIYNANGTQLKSIKKGLNIIKMSDGQVKKIFIK